MDNTDNSYGLRNEVLDSIRSIAVADDVGCLKLFGSRAGGDYRERSDIDLAVYGARSKTSGSMSKRVFRYC